MILVSVTFIPPTFIGTDEPMAIHTLSANVIVFVVRKWPNLLGEYPGHNQR